MPREGGIIISLGERMQLETILKEDPFFKNEIADYSFTEFIPVKYCKQLSELIPDPE